MRYILFVPAAVAVMCLVSLSTFSASAVEVSADTEGKKPPDPDAGYKRIFKRLDADGDGAVTEKEYVERSRWQDKNKARAIWRASDANGDGKVTEAEYCRNRRVTDKAKEVFAWLDANRDGKVTEAEAVGRAKRIFAEMDRDGDGQATIPEALGARWQWQVQIQWGKKRLLPVGKENPARPVTLRQPS